jgi:hypothetical protein
VNKQVTVNVTRKKNGASLLTVPAARHDLNTLPAMPEFQDLSVPQQKVLRRLYSEAAPSWVCDLTLYDEGLGSAPLQCGAYEFRCGRDALFSGVVEVLYEMRCILFHGELVPTKEAVACYEPAFRLVRRFLDCVI